MAQSQKEPEIRLRVPRNEDPPPIHAPRLPEPPQIDPEPWGRNRQFRRPLFDDSGLISGAIGVLVVAIIIGVLVIPVLIDTVNNSPTVTPQVKSIVSIVPVLLATLVIVAVASILLNMLRDL